MAKTSYVVQNDDGFAAQMDTFVSNLPAYATLLGVTTAQTTAAAADAAYYKYALACQKLMQNSAQQCTGWKDILREGGTPPPTGAPVAPVWPAAVPAVDPGVEPRFRAFARRLKAHPSYNPTIGYALGIEGPEAAPLDFTTLQPQLELSPEGGQVLVRWGWQGHGEALDLIELQVDRGDGQGYRLLAYDTTPNYLDTAAVPATGARWKYKAIYRVGDRRVGQWSTEASIAVGG